MPAGWAAAAAAVVAAGSAYMQSEAADDATHAQTEASNNAINAQTTQANQARTDTAVARSAGNAATTRLRALLGLGPETQTKPRARDEWIAANYPGSQPGGGSLTGGLGGVGTVGGVGVTPGLQKLTPDQGYQDYLNKFVPEEVPGAFDANSTGNSPLLRKFTADDFAADPVAQAGLKFGLDRGTEGINSRATASGMYDSGATLKALTQFGNDYGSTKVNDSYNRFIQDQSNTFNKLSGLAGSGQVATGQVLSSGTNAANNVSNELTGAGNARAAGVVAGANAWGNAGTGAVNAYGNYQSNQRLDALLARYPNSGGSPYPSGPSQPYYTGYGANGDYQYN